MMYDVVLLGSIVVTIVMVVMETDAVAKGGSPAHWVSVTSDAVLAMFIFDIALRIYIFRTCYLTHLSNWADLMIVGSDSGIVLYQYCTSGQAKVKALSFLRIFRLLRLGQTVQILEQFPELHLMLKGMTGAFKTLMWGLAVLLLMLLLWSIMAVQYIHPLNEELTLDGQYEGLCERCPRAFESVSASMLTFVKHLVAGDGWGEVCVPISEAYPWTFIFFLAVVTSVSLALLNLILAVIVDSAAQARSESEHDLAAMKEAEFKKQKKHLTRIFQALDKDKNGQLSWDELNDAIIESSEFNDTLTCMGISVHDLDMVWMLLDEQDTGKVTCEKFVEQLYRLRSTDNHNMTLLTKGLLLRMREDMQKLLAASGNPSSVSRSFGLGVSRGQKLTEFRGSKSLGNRSEKTSSFSQSDYQRLSENSCNGTEMSDVADERMQLPKPSSVLANASKGAADNSLRMC
jgi:hypothetical protein